MQNELTRWGLNVEVFDQTGEPPNADLVWLEPCANPMMSFPDLDVVIAQAHAAGSLVVVDNTVLSPLLLSARSSTVRTSCCTARARSWPATTTRCSARSCCARAEDHERLKAFRTASGIVAAPDPVWLLLRGLKTLSLRVERQSATALELARRLAAHPAVERVRYPGLGKIRSRRATSTPSGRCCPSTWRTRLRPRQVERSLKLIENATSLGGVASTLEARARWEPARVPPGLLRLSVGPGGRRGPVGGPRPERSISWRVGRGRGWVGCATP